MKRHKLLRAMATAGIMSVAAAAIIRPSTFGMPARVASQASAAALAAVRQWLHGAPTHLTTTQLVWAAALAWLLFVLSLVLLARSRPAESWAQAPRLDMSNAATLPDVGRRPQGQVTEAMPHAVAPPLPIRPAPGDELVEYQELTNQAPRGQTTGALAVVPVAPDPVVEQRVEPAEQATRPIGTSDGSAVSQRRGHLLALAGSSLAREGLFRYGLFILAEDTGIARTGGKASRRMVEVIAEQMAPWLASDRTLGSMQFAALLKMAVLRARIDLRQLSIRTATGLGAVVAGVMVIGDVAYVVNAGDCRAYVFRPGEGLVQITTNHAATPRLAENELPESESLRVDPRRDQICPCAEDDQVAAGADMFEVYVHPDDLVLLCSPRLWRALRKPQIEAILRTAPDSRSAAELLAREGKARSGEQDLSVLVVRPLEDAMAEFGMAASSGYVP